MVVLTCFVMCGCVYVGCFDNCMDVLVICVFVFIVFLMFYCFLLFRLYKFILISLAVLV